MSTITMETENEIVQDTKVASRSIEETFNRIVLELLFANWDRVKDTFVPRLVNREKNKKMLENVPYREFLDLAVIFTALVTVNGQKKTITVRNEYLQGWGKTIDDVEAAAMTNAPKLLPFNTLDFLEVVEKSASRAGGSLEEEEKEAIRKIGFRIVSNTELCYGAATILYDGVLEELAEMMGGDFYILPSSVHEVLALPDGGQNPKRMSKNVAKINATQLLPKEVLSDHVYFYDASVKELRVA